MKIRLGFVSNSSSSSFAIYGEYFEYSDLPERLASLIEENPGDLPQNKQNLTCINGEEGAYIGLGFEDMEENETKAQFKVRAAHALKEYFRQFFPEEKIRKISPTWEYGEISN